jgi:hypothetical protein
MGPGSWPMSAQGGAMLPPLFRGRPRGPGGRSGRVGKGLRRKRLVPPAGDEPMAVPLMSISRTAIGIPRR